MDYTTSMYIRLYFYIKGSFDGIEKTYFYPLVEDMYKSSYNSVSNMTDFLYTVLGYKSTPLARPSEVFEKRKEFTLKSGEPKYIRSLLKEYNCQDKTHLVETLTDCGIFGIPDYRATFVGRYSELGLDGRAISQYTSVLLSVLFPYLENSVYNSNGDTLGAIRRSLLYEDFPMIKETLINSKILTVSTFTIQYDNRLRKPKFLDGILYTSSVEGFTEEELTYQLILLYLLGAPAMYPGYRDYLRNIVTSCVFTPDESTVLTVIDCATLANMTVEKMLNYLGLAVPDPSHLWSKYGGVVNVLDYKELLYSVPGMQVPMLYNIEDFLQQKNSNTL